jgi:hypothetical protein
LFSFNGVVKKSSLINEGEGWGQVMDEELFYQPLLPTPCSLLLLLLLLLFDMLLIVVMPCSSATIR